MAVFIYTLILVLPIVLAVFGLKAFFKWKEEQDIQDKRDRVLFFAYIYQYRGALMAFGFLVSMLFAIAAWNYQYEFKVIIEGEMQRELLADDFNVPVITEQKKRPKPKPIKTPQIQETKEELLDPPELDFDTIREEEPVVVLFTDDEGDDEAEEVVIDDGFDATDVDQLPGFPGGAAQRRMFIRKNFHFTGAEKKRLKGKKVKIYVAFDVLQNGQLSNVRITKGFNQRLDEEAMRVVAMMPKFTPGMRQGIPVKVNKVILPITFQL